MTGINCVIIHATFSSPEYTYEQQCDSHDCRHQRLPSWPHYTYISPNVKIVMKCLAGINCVRIHAVTAYKSKSMISPFWTSKIAFWHIFHPMSKCMPGINFVRIHVLSASLGHTLSKSNSTPCTCYHLYNTDHSTLLRMFSLWSRLQPHWRNLW